MPKKEQLERAEKVNQLIKFIADIDRELCKPYSSFFFSKMTLKGTENNYGRFEFIGTKLFFIDKFTEERIYPYNRCGKARGFSSGGTIWALVNDFREWIIKGVRSNGKHGYAGLYCPYWGGNWTLELKDRVIKKAKEIGYLDGNDITFTQYCLRVVGEGNDWIVKDYIESIKELVG